MSGRMRSDEVGLTARRVGERSEPTKPNQQDSGGGVLLPAKPEWSDGNPASPTMREISYVTAIYFRGLLRKEARSDFGCLHLIGRSFIRGVKND